MMRMKTKTAGLSAVNGSSGDSDGGRSNGGRSNGGEREWELRPGGMLVQKRDPDSDQNAVPPPPNIRVRVKYGSICHQINISPQATFGELKKMLSGPTGLHHQDQKLVYKGKERDSNAFLDMAGVKNRSKIGLMEDPISQEKRYLEMRRNAKMEKASKSISDISLEVDRLAGQVSALESVISRGGKVAEKEMLNLIELLMNQLLRLDGIIADGDVKLQRKMQVRRVQKYVETLDVLKLKNSAPSSGEIQIQKQPHPQRQHQRMYSNGQIPPSFQQQQEQQQASRHSHSTSGAVVITTNWETFDSVPSTSSTPTHGNSVHPKFNWDLL